VLREDVEGTEAVCLGEGVGALDREVLDVDGTVTLVGVVTRDGIELLRMLVVLVGVRVGVVTRAVLPLDGSFGATVRLVEIVERPEARDMLLPGVTIALRLVDDERVALGVVVPRNAVPREVVVRLEDAGTLRVLRVEAVEVWGVALPRRDEEPLERAVIDLTDRDPRERACSASCTAAAVLARVPSLIEATRGRAIRWTSDRDVRWPPLPTTRTVVNSLRPALRSSLETRAVAASLAVPCVSGPRITRRGA